MTIALAMPSEMFSSEALIGRSFVLGLPDRSGAYRVGLACNVWQIRAGGYTTGDRVKVVSVDHDELAVEKV
jgi:membrane protein implicated in regulation of membrane protease activity